MVVENLFMKILVVLKRTGCCYCGKSKGFTWSWCTW